MRIRFGIFLAAAALAGMCQGAEKKIVSLAWEWASTGPGELLKLQPQIADSGVDGIDYELRFAHGDKFYGSRNMMQEPKWDWSEIEPEVARYRKCFCLPGLRESFLSGFRAPKKRIDWADDAAWEVVENHMRLLGRFAKQVGFVGMVVDYEDYFHQNQFTRIESEPPLTELAALARRRGAQVFGATFEEFPEAKLLFMWFFTELSRTYTGSSQALEASLQEGTVLAYFLNGILDVLPPKAKIIDGNERSYEFSSADYEYFLNIRGQRDGLASFAAKENREKYDNQVSYGSSLYLEQYVQTNKLSKWYRQPWAGSRLGMYRRDLHQALASTDEYVWFWNERTPFVKRVKTPDFKPERWIDPIWWNKTLEETMPGFYRATRAIHRPHAFAAAEIDAIASSASTNLVAGLLTDKKSGTWQEEDKKRKPGVFKMTAAGELSVSGVKSGCAMLRVKKVQAGEIYAVKIQVKRLGGGASAAMVSQRNGAWRFFVPVTCVDFAPADADGWQQGTAVIAIAEGVDAVTLMCNVRQGEKDSCLWRNAEIYKVD